MILDAFFKPKWQHASSEVRRAAVAGMAGSDPALLRLAQEDADPGVRLVAVEKLTGLDLLHHLWMQDPEARVREAAALRLRAVLAGHAADGPALDQRLEKLNRLSEPDLAAFLLRQAREPRMRLAAMDQVHEDVLLQPVALEDPALEVRLAAVERVRAAEVLETIARESRKRDKRISRRAGERFDAMVAARRRVERCQQACSELESLAQGALEPIAVLRVQRLVKEWEDLAGVADEEQRRRFTQAGERFEARRRDLEAQQARALAICERLEALVRELEQVAEPTSDPVSRAQAELAALEAEWQEVEPASGRDFQPRFQAGLAAVRATRERLLRDHQLAERMQALIARISRRLEDKDALREQDLKDFKRRWSNLDRPASEALAQALEVRFQEVLESMRGRLKRQAERREHEIEVLEQWLGELDGHLSRGELQPAISLHDKIRHRLQKAEGVPPARRAGLSARLHEARPRLDELRGWRRWGTGQAREGLCAEVESLSGQDVDPADVGARVRAARAQWQHMDREEGPAPAELWQRFDQACTRAYEPVQAYVEEQSRLQEQSLQGKRELCAGLDEFERTVDWTNPDWAQVERTVQDARRRWREFGPVPRKHVKGIEKVYREVMKRLDGRLHQEREQEIERRKKLIDRAQALIQVEDLRAALSEARDLQSRWQPTVRGRRREEEALWRDFRTACDAVFARRDSEREAARAERQSNLARKVALCEEIETLTRAPAEELARAVGRMAAIGAEWDGAGQVAKADQQAIERRYRVACEAFAQRRREALEAQSRAELEGMRLRAELCDRLEALIIDDERSSDLAAAVHEAQVQWSALAPLGDDVEGPLRRRFEAAAGALERGGEARQALLDALGSNIDLRRDLCLRAEVLAGVESPPEFAQARMALQVSRLSQTLGGQGSQEEAQGLRELFWQWCRVGPVPREHHAELEARFRNAIAGRL